MHPFAKALLVAFPAGALASLASVPLPWVIGPMIGCMVANLLGAGLACPQAARHAGQWAVGVSLGLFFTPAVVASLVGYAPWIAAAIVWAILFSLAFAWVLMRYAGADRQTAFFAGVAGGASEMAIQGERHGARVDQVAACHALRIMLVVITLPLAFRLLGLGGTDPYDAGVQTFDLAGATAIGALALAAAVLLHRLGLPNAWILGPLAVAFALTASGQSWSAWPQSVVIGGQTLLGASFGVRFTPDFFSRAPRFLSVAAIATLAGIVACAVAGSALGWLAGVPVATMVLATAPGGIAEMTLTAKSLRLGVPVVTVFQVSRMVAMVFLAEPLFRLFGRLGNDRPSERRSPGGPDGC